MSCNFLYFDSEQGSASSVPVVVGGSGGGGPYRELRRCATVAVKCSLIVIISARDNVGIERPSTESQSIDYIYSRSSCGGACPDLVCSWGVAVSGHGNTNTDSNRLANMFTLIPRSINNDECK